jgi:hypothetical protein
MSKLLTASLRMSAMNARRAAGERTQGYQPMVLAEGFGKGGRVGVYVDNEIPDILDWSPNHHAKFTPLQLSPFSDRLSCPEEDARQRR